MDRQYNGQNKIHKGVIRSCKSMDRQYNGQNKIHKGVIRICKSMDRQYNGQNKKDKRTTKHYTVRKQRLSNTNPTKKMLHQGQVRSKILTILFSTNPLDLIPPNIKASTILSCIYNHWVLFVFLGKGVLDQWQSWRCCGWYLMVDRTGS